ncbi:hypothetical protein HanPSC8_Chr06g0248611 [Helianthus annuus]|nr:hypothetical protein HanIR_Chr06g0277061 [Helianthus annuus]KAJ0915329.1 hypothetical protein HanPSC8_Chr06g0248611 [Helianthus annuus]
MIHMPDFSLFLTHRHVPLIFTFLLFTLCAHRASNTSLISSALLK